MMPTIKDVAREAGVSIATVSYVLNNKNNAISSETRHHVLETARRIGYTPNVTARNLRFSRTGLIGYAWHEVPRQQVNPVMDRFTYYLAQAAESVGYHLLTFTHPADDPVPVYDELIRMGRLDAYVLSAMQRQDARANLLLERQFPFAAFGRSEASARYPWADVDGESGIRQAIETFYACGHRRIGMVAWADDGSHTARTRREAFEHAMADFGLSWRADWLYEGDHSEATGRRALARWDAQPPLERPSAVFAISDLEAIGILNEALQRGYEVGRDVSVIGFDDVPMAQYLRPALTTFRQPVIEAAEKLIEMLHQLLNGETPQPCHHLLAPELVQRGSVGAPRS